MVSFRRNVKFNLGKPHNDIAYRPATFLTFKMRLYA